MSTMLEKLNQMKEEVEPKEINQTGEMIDKLAEDRAINSSYAKITRNNSRDIHEVSGNIVRSEEHEGVTELERQSNSILTTTRGNDRNDIDDSRSIPPSNNLLDKIASRFKAPKQKPKEEEKQKTLDEIIQNNREQAKLRAENKVKIKNKSKNYIEHDR